MVRHLAIFVTASVFALMLLTSVSIENAVAAVALGLVAVATAWLLRRVTRRPVSFAGADAMALTRATACIPGDAARVGIKLLRAAIIGDVTGRAPTVAFRFGKRDDAAQRGRRAAAVLAGSLTPDTIVVDIAPDEGKARLHRLLATPDPDDAERLT